MTRHTACDRQASKRRVEAETNNANKVEATAKSAEENLQQREGELRCGGARAL